MNGLSLPIPCFSQPRATAQLLSPETSPSQTFHLNGINNHVVFRVWLFHSVKCSPGSPVSQPSASHSLPWLEKTVWQGYIAFYVPTHHVPMSVDIQVLSSFRLLGACMHESLPEYLFSALWSSWLEVELPGHRLTLR